MYIYRQKLGSTIRLIPNIEYKENINIYKALTDS